MRRKRNTDDWPSLLEAFYLNSEPSSKSPKILAGDFVISVEDIFFDALNSGNVEFWTSRLSDPKDLTDAFSGSKLLQSLGMKNEAHFSNIFVSHTYFHLLSQTQHRIDREKAPQSLREETVKILNSVLEELPSERRRMDIVRRFEHTIRDIEIMDNLPEIGEPEPKPEPQPKPEPEPKPEPQPKPEPEPEPKPEPEPEPVPERKPEPKPEPVPEPEPRPDLLERMKAMAEANENGDIADNASPSGIFNTLVEDQEILGKGVRLLWSGSEIFKRFTNKGIRSVYAFSTGKNELSSSTDDLRKQGRERDSNQDLIAIQCAETNRADSRIERVFVFDGVSESLRPREWAEALLESAIETKLSIRTMRNAEVLNQWHEIALNKWKSWIKNEYEPNRQQDPRWMEDRRRENAHTTLIIYEPSNKRRGGKVALVGDSPVFAFTESGSPPMMIPSDFDHATGPETIGTNKIPSIGDFTFETIQPHWKKIILCTDSIGDYLHQNIDNLDGAFNFLRRCTEEDGWRQFLSAEVKAGRAQNGLKDDDLSLLMFHWRE